MMQNVYMILAERIRIIRGRMPAAVRAELMQAVKDGRLGRLRKDGLKPEVFYRPACGVEAAQAREDEALRSIQSIAQVLA